MELLWFVDGAYGGAENMRRDRASFTRAELDPRVDVVLRVYGWSPPAVSLGFHQDESALDPAALRARGFDLVRRPTGGAAVLHHEEITYAVTGRLGVDGLGRAVLDVHEGIARALRGALVDLGVSARSEGDGRPSGFACFGAAGGHEITVDGRKLVGSALRRGRAAFLQHGSLLVGDAHLDLIDLLLPPADETDVSDWRDRQRRRLRERTCSLRELGADHVDAESFATALSARLSAQLGVGARQVAAADVLGRPEEDPALRS